jgi:hypothetical protein
MTSFFPTDAIRSRLEWNATLNPGAAPQTTEETKYHRKVITVQRWQCDDPLLIASPDVHHRDHR